MKKLTPEQRIAEICFDEMSEQFGTSIDAHVKRKVAKRMADEIGKAINANAAEDVCPFCGEKTIDIKIMEVNNE